MGLYSSSDLSPSYQVEEQCSAVERLCENHFKHVCVIFPWLFVLHEVLKTRQYMIMSLASQPLRTGKEGCGQLSIVQYSGDSISPPDNGGTAVPGVNGFDLTYIVLRRRRLNTYTYTYTITCVHKVGVAPIVNCHIKLGTKTVVSYSFKYADVLKFTVK